MSNSQMSAGQTQGQAQAKTEQWVESAKSTTSAAHDRAADAANANPSTTQQQKDNSAGWVQQTGEQVINMAQGALDGMKNTLGVGDQQNQKK